MFKQVKRSGPVLLALGLAMIIAGPSWAGAGDLRKHPAADITKGPSWVEGRVILVMKPGASERSVNTAMAALAGQKGYSAKALGANSAHPIMLITADTVDTVKMVDAFKTHKDVRSVSPDYIISVDALPNDTSYDKLWALDNQGQEVNETPGTADADIDAPEAWEKMNATDPVVIAAVIDTGIDYSHSDLAANMWTNTAEVNGETGVDDDNNGYVDDIYGIDTANDDGDPYDDHSHGTHVAGTIAGVSDNNEGVTGVSRNKARLMALKFLGANGRGALSDAIECIYYAIEMNRRAQNNVVVINASWGSLSTSDAMETAIGDAYDAGIVFSAAAGNRTNDCDGNRKHYPSCIDQPNVIAVSATNQNDNLAYFSNYGASECDIAAPGVNILSAIPGGGYTPISTDLFFDGMEKGKDLWDMEMSEGVWDITDEQAFDDNKAWSDSPGGDYEMGPMGINLHYTLISKAIDLSQAQEPLMLGFWLYKDLNPTTASCGRKDELYVDVSGDDGATWQTLALFSKSDPTWKSYAYNIPQELYTQTFRIRFYMSIVPTGVADGIYLDNIGVGTANALGAFAYYKGTSMAAPHVTGAVCLTASMYPDESVDKRVGRILLGGDKLDSLKGFLSMDARLNLDRATDSDLADMPMIKSFETLEGRTFLINGSMFKDTPGTVWFHDAVDPHNGVPGEILSWGDTEISVNKPPYSGGYFSVKDADGNISPRRQYKISLWEEKTASQTKRDSLTAQYLDGVIYTFGGYAGGDNSLRSWETYDVATDSWTYQYGKWMPHFAAHLTSAVLDGKIYLIGGYDSHGDGANLSATTLFDPGTQTFEAKEDFPEPACFMKAVTVGGKIWVTGGMGVDDTASSLIRTYDPARAIGQRWVTETISLITERFEHGAVALDTKIYLFGGLKSWADDEYIYLKSGEIIDTVTGQVTPMADMPRAFARMGACTDGRYIYAIGGTGNDFWRTPLDIALRYDPETDTWVSLADRTLLTAKITAPALFVPPKGVFCVNGGFINTEGAPGMFGYPFQAMNQTAFLAVELITDSDGDTIPDADDNCRLTVNSDQRDSDDDGHGNACDCDLNNDNMVTLPDFTKFRSLWNSTDDLADFNGDGSVGLQDFMIFRERWNSTAPFE